MRMPLAGLDLPSRGTLRVTIECKEDEPKCQLSIP